MKRTPIVSSNIKSAGFENGVMQIEFANGRVYDYTGPKVQEHFDNFMKAESKGAHFAKHIRPCPHTKFKLNEEPV